MANTIRISDDAQEYLSGRRRPGESWSKVIRRSLKDFDEFLKRPPKTAHEGNDHEISPEKDQIKD